MRSNKISMADDDGFLDASPVNGDDSIQLASQGSSDEEYERMTAAEVLEKLEEVSLRVSSLKCTHFPSPCRLG